MKVVMNYKKNSYRWKNYEDFILEKIENKTKNEVLFIVLSFNSADLLIKNTKKLNKENVDFLVLDNFSNDDNSNKLRKYVKNNNFSYIKLNNNLGGAGGYSMGIEYFLANNQYKKIIISEDDAISLDNEVLNKMIKKSIKYDEVLIKYKEIDGSSFGLHFHLYNKDMIERAGVLDINYFMRSDDYEYGKRMYKDLSKIKSFTIEDCYYSHPCFKDNEKYSTIYFITRNNLKTFLRHEKKSFYIYSYFYLLNDIIFLLSKKNLKLLKVRLIAYKDFLINNFNIDRNKFILSNFNQKINEDTKEIISKEEFHKKIKNKNIIDDFLVSISKLNNIKIINKLSFKEMITRDYSLRMNFLYSLVKKNIVVYEYDNNVHYNIINNNQLLNLIILLFSIPISLIIYIPFIILSIIRYICGKIWKNTM